MKNLNAVNSILDQIRETKEEICSPQDKRLVLLNVDLDMLYSRHMPAELINKTNDFMARAREHMQIVHIWHFDDYIHIDDYDIKYNEERYARENVPVPFVPEQHKDYFPLINASPEDLVMAKHGFDAFQDTGLRDILPDNAIVFALGTRGDYCVEATLSSGCSEGFNMAAIMDLIYAYSGPYPDTANLKSDKILSALEL